MSGIVAVLILALGLYLLVEYERRAVKGIEMQLTDLSHGRASSIPLNMIYGENAPSVPIPPLGGLSRIAPAPATKIIIDKQ